jgi:hypothetical protein
MLFAFRILFCGACCRVELVAVSTNVKTDTLEKDFWLLILKQDFGKQANVSQIWDIKKLFDQLRQVRFRYKRKTKVLFKPNQSKSESHFNFCQNYRILKCYKSCLTGLVMVILAMCNDKLFL